MALACDIRVTVEEAELGLSEVTRGMILGSGGTQRLGRLVGIGKALELILTGAIIEAREAYHIGLVSKVVPRSDFVSAAEDYARRIASNGPLAVVFAKEAIRKGYELPLEDGLRLETDLSSLHRPAKI